MRKKVVIPIGRPACGKGTTQPIFERLGFVPFSMSGALKKSPLLTNADKKRMMEGFLLPDDLVVPVMHEAFREVPFGKDLLLDGFPRTVGQVHGLFGILGQEYDVYTLYLDLNTKAAVNRALYQRRRPDDTLEVLRNRMEQYSLKTVPAIRLLADNTNFSQIDVNDKDIDEVARLVCDFMVEKLGFHPAGINWALKVA